MSEVRCVNCGKRYRLKGEVKSRDFVSLPCPECGGSLEPVENEDVEATLLENFLLDRPLALIFWDAPENKATLLHALQELAFEPRLLKKASHLAHWLRFHTPALLILVCEDFSRLKPFFHILNNLAVNERREIFTIWISSAVRTLDPRKAFLHSLHLVIHPEDLPRFAEIYQKAKRVWDGFYQPLRQAQEVLTKEKFY